MARSVTMSKVSPTAGEIIPDSETQVVLVGGLAGDKHPTASFIHKDLIRAMENIAAQEVIGIRAK